MHASPWIGLLKRIPLESHGQVVVYTSAGVEMVVQTILQIEGDFFAFRGRLAASPDAGRLFLIPYDNIDYLGVNRFVTEEEFRAWLDDPAAALPAAMPAPESNGGTAENGLGTESGSVAGGRTTPAGGTRSPLANRAALLERIRSRPTPTGGTAG
jgi:hypothetical protein